MGGFSPGDVVIHKDANRKALWAVAIANIGAFYALTHAPFAGADALDVLRTWPTLIPSALTLVLVGLLNSQVDNMGKARIVFWRWDHPLPGSAAFSKWGPLDNRVNMPAIELKFGPLPADPGDQNRLWYRMYQTVRDLPEVQHGHREFLLARDIACVTVIFAVILAPAGLFMMKPTIWVAYGAGLLAQYLIATRAARVLGTRLVSTVLALKGAGK